MLTAAQRADILTLEPWKVLPKTLTDRGVTRAAVLDVIFDDELPAPYIRELITGFTAQEILVHGFTRLEQKLAGVTAAVAAGAQSAPPATPAPQPATTGHGGGGQGHARLRGR